MNIQFGAGMLIGFSGDKSPVQFGALQGVELSFDGSIKELFGQYQLPIATARGTAKVNGKAQFANINATLLGNLYFNETPAPGQTLLAINEAGTVPAGQPYKITVSKSATFVTDYGVIDAETGLPFKKVLGAPTAAGEYQLELALGVPTGAYVFASDDASNAVKISYSYTVATGKTITITNQLLGDAPVFQVMLQQTFDSKKFGVVLYKCTSSKLSIPTKLEDFVISDFEFGAFVNDAGVLGILSFPE